MPEPDNAPTGRRAWTGPGSVIGEFRQRVQRWGWRRALYWNLMHALTKLGFHVHYIRISSDRPDLVAPPRPLAPGYEIRLVGYQDLLPFAGAMTGLTEAFLEQAFSSLGEVPDYTDECAAAFYDGELVSYAFTTRTRAPVTDQIDILVPKGFRYSYKSWTHPDHRRQHLSRTMTHLKWTRSNRPHQERGVSYIETHNYASLLRSHRSISDRAIPMGFAGWFTLFGRQIPWNSRKARWLGCEMVRKEDTRVRQICW